MSSLSPSSDSLPPTSPKPKTVAFAPPSSLAVSSSAAPSPSSSPAPSSPTQPHIPASPSPVPSSPRPTPKRRRSSLKQGTAMPYRPPAEQYQHPDPLLRRLRLRDGYGKEADLQREFKEAKVVLFFFGATWPGSVPEPFDLVRDFAKQHPHQCKVVFVSIDSSVEAYESNTRQKPWVSMVWNDGSNTSDSHPSSSSSSQSPLLDPQTPPLEPFLLAGDPDLEEDLSLSLPPDPSLYLRPYSRVFLAEKWNVLGVPSLAVYHPESRKMLSYHARFDLLKAGKRERTWERWSRGERIEFTTGDFLYAIRWSLGAAAIASMYMVAVKAGVITDVLGEATAKLTQNYLANR
ncbi:hypothetical protein JCM8547_009265 [Rhodosporidiobolus lusitaniae]